MGQKRNPRGSHSATGADPRSDKKVCALVRTSFRAAMRAEGASVREAARWMRVAPSTVQRHLKSGFLLPVLRSKRLAGPFARALCDQIAIRKRKAA